MNILYSDVASIICEYLPYDDLDNLKHEYPDSKVISNKAPKLMVESITSRLEEYFGPKEYPIFRQHLDTSHGIIAGGFPGKCLRGEPCGDSDIDIFIPLHSNPIHYTGQDGKSGNKITNLEIYLEDVFTYKGYVASSRYGSDIGDDEINWIRTYHLGDHERTPDTRMEACKNCIAVQVIQVNTTADVLPIFIKNSFDFSVCKTLYWIENGKDRLDVFNIEGIMKKRFKFEHSTRLGSSIQRYYKYKEKGYDIDLGNLDELFSRIRGSYDKYYDLPRHDPCPRTKIYDIFPEHLRGRIDTHPSAIHHCDSKHQIHGIINNCPAKLCKKPHKHYRLYNRDDIIVLTS